MQASLIASNDCACQSDVDTYRGNQALCQTGLQLCNFFPRILRKTALYQIELYLANSIPLPLSSANLLQEYREQRAEELMGVLSSLWEALEVEQEDVDRGIFARLMSGPARLHGKSIQKVLLCYSCSWYPTPIAEVIGILMIYINAQKPNYCRHACYDPAGAFTSSCPSTVLSRAILHQFKSTCNSLKSLQTHDFHVIVWSLMQGPWCHAMLVWSPALCSTSG